MEQESIEEAAERLTEKAYQNEEWDKGRLKRTGYYQGIIDGTKWQQERSYSEEEVKNAFLEGWELRDGELTFRKAKNKWFNEFKKK